MIIKTAILGYGLSGSTFHGPFLKASPDFEVVKIQSSRKEQILRDFPQALPVTDAQEVFSDPQVDLVVITTPNTTHFPYAKQAMEAGKHVVVEKPFTPTLEEARELEKISARTGKLLSVYQNRRWDGDFLTIKQILEDGLLGDVYQFESHFDRFRPEARDRWREKNLPGSGIHYDLGAHVLDQSFHLFGEPQWIWGDVLAQKPDAQTDDYFHMILGYGKMRVLLHSSTFCAGKTIRFALHGTKGSYIKYGLDPQEDRLREGQIPSDQLGEEDSSHYGILSTAEGSKIIPTLRGDYRVYFSKLAEAIRGEGPLPVTASEGIKVIRGLETIKDNPLTRHNWS